MPCVLHDHLDGAGGAMDFPLNLNKCLNLNLEVNLRPHKLYLRTKLLIGISSQKLHSNYLFQWGEKENRGGHCLTGLRCDLIFLDIILFLPLHHFVDLQLSLGLPAFESLSSLPCHDWIPRLPYFTNHISCSLTGILNWASHDIAYSTSDVVTVKNT